jgi:uncharacterized integral membrane protein
MCSGYITTWPDRKPEPVCGNRIALRFPRYKVFAKFGHSNHLTMKNLTARDIVNIILLVLLAIFVIQNWVITKVQFLMFGFEAPLVLLLVIVFFIGYLTARGFKRKK